MAGQNDNSLQQFFYAPCGGRISSPNFFAISIPRKWSHFFLAAVLIPQHVLSNPSIYQSSNPE
jgi:hypothetical protein